MICYVLCFKAANRIKVVGFCEGFVLTSSKATLGEKIFVELRMCKCFERKGNKAKIKCRLNTGLV